MVYIPTVSFNIKTEESTSGLTAHKVLIVAQTNSTKVSKLTLVKNITKDTITNYFNENEVVTDMLKEYFVYNKVNEVSVLPIVETEDFIKAQGKIVFSGTATEDGELVFHIGKRQSGASTENRNNCKFTLNVKKGDTAESLKTALETKLINVKDTIYSVVTSAEETDVTTVILGANNGGAVGNSYYLAYEGSVAGLTITLNKFEKGSSTLEITQEELENAIGGNQYKTIIWQPSFSLEALKKFLDNRFSLQYIDKSCVAITSIIDTKENLLKINNYGELLAIQTDKLLDKDNIKGGVLGQPAHILATTVGSYRALKMSIGTDISSFVNTTAESVQNGNYTSVSLPYANTKFNNLNIDNLEDNFNSEEMNELESAGLGFFDYDLTNEVVVLGSLPTSTNAKSDNNEDVVFHFLETVDIALTTREYFFNNFKNTYKQATVTTGVPKVDIQVSEEMLIDFFTQRYTELVNYGLLDDGGTEEFNKTLTIQIDVTGELSKQKLGRAIAGSVFVTFRVLCTKTMRYVDVTMLLK